MPAPSLPLNADIPASWTRVPPFQPAAASPPPSPPPETIVLRVYEELDEPEEKQDLLEAIEKAAKAGDASTKDALEAKFAKLMDKTRADLEVELDEAEKEYAGQWSQILEAVDGLQQQSAAQQSQKLRYDPKLPAGCRLVKVTEWLSRSLEDGMLEPVAECRRDGSKRDFTISLYGVEQLRLMISSPERLEAINKIQDKTSFSLSPELFAQNSPSMELVEEGGLYVWITPLIKVSDLVEKLTVDELKRLLGDLFIGCVGGKVQFKLKMDEQSSMHYVGTSDNVAARERTHLAQSVNTKVAILRKVVPMTEWRRGCVFKFRSTETAFSSYALESLLNLNTKATKHGVGLNYNAYDFCRYMRIATKEDVRRIYLSTRQICIDYGVLIQYPSKMLRGQIHVHLLTGLFQSHPLPLSAFASTPAPFRPPEQIEAGKERNLEQPLFPTAKPAVRPKEENAGEGHGVALSRQRAENASAESSLAGTAAEDVLAKAKAARSNQKAGSGKQRFKKGKLLTIATAAPSTSTAPPPLSVPPVLPSPSLGSGSFSPASQSAPASTTSFKGKSGGKKRQKVEKEVGEAEGE